jgi:hypothetical protein
VIPVPQLVPAVVVTTLTGAIMLRMGLRKGLLRPRFESRRCPSCGRTIDVPVCPTCARC